MVNQQLGGSCDIVRIS